MFRNLPSGLSRPAMYSPRWMASTITSGFAAMTSGMMRSSAASGDSRRSPIRCSGSIQSPRYGGTIPMTAILTPFREKIFHSAVFMGVTVDFMLDASTVPRYSTSFFASCPTPRSKSWFPGTKTSHPAALSAFSIEAPPSIVAEYDPWMRSPQSIQRSGLSCSAMSAIWSSPGDFASPIAPWMSVVCMIVSLTDAAETAGPNPVRTRIVRRKQTILCMVRPHGCLKRIRRPRDGFSRRRCTSFA